MTAWMASLLVFAMLVAAGWSAWQTVSAEQHVSWMLLRRRVGGQAGAGASLGASSVGGTGPWWLGPFAGFVWDLAARAGRERAVHQVSMTLVLFGLAGAAVLGTVFGWHAAPFGLLAAAVPVVSLYRRGARRARLVSEQLPDALDYIAHALRAGHGFTHAIQQASEEVPSPVADELRVVAESTRLGLPMTEGFERMLAHNPDNIELRMFVSASELHRKTGGNLAAILEQMAETIRERLVFESKVIALTTEVRTSSRILGTLPVLAALALFVAAPRYLGVLFFDPTGRIIGVTAVALGILAFLIMGRMARVEVDV